MFTIKEAKRFKAAAEKAATNYLNKGQADDYINQLMVIVEMRKIINQKSK